MEDVKPPASPEEEIHDDIDNWARSPANPNNWTRRKKLYHTSICATYAFTMYYVLTTTMILPVR